MPRHKGSPASFPYGVQDQSISALMYPEATPNVSTLVRDALAACGIGLSDFIADGYVTVSYATSMIQIQDTGETASGRIAGMKRKVNQVISQIEGLPEPLLQTARRCQDWTVAMGGR